MDYKDIINSKFYNDGEVRWSRRHHKWQPLRDFNPIGNVAVDVDNDLNFRPQPGYLLTETLDLGELPVRTYDMDFAFNGLLFPGAIEMSKRQLLPLKDHYPGNLHQAQLRLPLPFDTPFDYTGLLSAQTRRHVDAFGETYKLPTSRYRSLQLTLYWNHPLFRRIFRQEFAQSYHDMETLELEYEAPQRSLTMKHPLGSCRTPYGDDIETQYTTLNEVVPLSFLATQLSLGLDPFYLNQSNNLREYISGSTVDDVRDAFPNLELTPSVIYTPLSSPFYHGFRCAQDMREELLSRIHNSLYSTEGFLEGIDRYNMGAQDFDLLTGINYNLVRAQMYDHQQRLYNQEGTFRFRLDDDKKGDAGKDHYYYSLHFSDINDTSDQYPTAYINKLKKANFNTTEAYTIIKNRSKAWRADSTGSIRRYPFEKSPFNPGQSISIETPFQFKGETFDIVGEVGNLSKYANYDYIKHLNDIGLGFLELFRLTGQGVDFFRYYMYLTAPSYRKALLLDSKLYHTYVDRARAILNNPNLWKRGDLYPTPN